MGNRLLGVMKSGNPIIIFGCTEFGAEICSEIRAIDDNVKIFFFDNDALKQKTDYCNIPVLDSEELKELLQSAYYIIAGLSVYQEMYRQLVDWGVKETRIILPEAILIHHIQLLEEQLKRYQGIVAKRTPKKKLGFVMDLAEHCNLNCQSCDHFSPLAKPYMADIREFQNDLSRMRFLFGDDITFIALEGGEPLLNPNVSEFIYTAHELFPATQIQIFTNGLLLPKMSEDFWKACRICDVVLEVTKYPIEFNYDEVTGQALQYGVRFQYYSGGDEIKTSMYKPLDLEGKQDKYANYHQCWNANSDCIMLKKGKLYTCTRIPNLETFNQFFHQNIEITDRDYIDIYSDVTAEEIFEFLSNPMPACRYCRICDWTGGHEWKTTRRAITEWT